VTIKEAAHEPEAPPSAAWAKNAPLPRSLSIWTGYLLSRVSQRCRDQFDALLEPLGIKGRHYTVLALLAEAPGLAQIEMSERLGIDRNTMVLLLNDLEALEFVERGRDPHDRRAHCVRLTENGAAALSQGTALAQRVNDEVFAPLSAEERRHLHDILDKLIEGAHQV
jgi:DNA-binding MarR family transcriptional regulator